MSEFDLVTLRNGHRAVRHLPSGEVMHPSIGPWEEANALYVRQLDLVGRLGRSGPDLRVFDVGLGAGTNAMAALEAARGLGRNRARGLEVVSFERDLEPLRLALGDPDGFAPQARWAPAARALMDHGMYSEDGLTWTLRPGDLLPALELERAPAELIFYDPFSPQVNPELWTPAALAKVRAKASEEGEGALLSTYSAATPTRLSLLLAGFFVGVGAPTGSKGETTVASTRLAALTQPLDARFLARWKRSSARAPHGSPLTPELERGIEQHPQFQAASR